MKHSRAKLGREGEEAAAELVQSMGYSLVARNFRCRAGEVDIVAQDGDSLVFIEVRTLSSARFGAPQESIGFRKIRRMKRVAQHFLRSWGSDPPCRFDVVAVRTQPDGTLWAELIRDAI